MRQRRRLPGICWHKSLERWYVTLDGKQCYLSGRLERTKAPPAEVQAAYDRTLARWLAERAVMPEPVAPEPTLDELWLGYLGAVEAGPKYHRRGKPTSEIQLIKDACRQAARLFGTEPARDFGPLKLEAVRAVFVEMGWTRQTISKAIGRIRRMFRWGASRELIPAAVYHALQALPGLTAAEHPHADQKIGDVADDILEETARHLPPVLAALVRVHRLIGCRAQEILVARTMDFDTEADAGNGAAVRCWLFTPAESKTGASYWIGPRAQALLLPLLRPDDQQAYIFSTRRKDGTPRANGRGCWTTNTYALRIAKCCQKHGIPHWSPIAIRHAAAEEARQKHPRGLEAVQSRLRHSKMSTSEIYAHNLNVLGREVARLLG